MRVREIMSRPVITCGPRDALSAAARLMWENDIGMIPVVHEEKGLVGVVTDRDVAMAAYLCRAPLHTIPIEEAMSATVVSCHPDDTVDGTEQVMRESRVRRVPVLDEENHPIGVLSLNDLARAAAREGAEKEEEHTLVGTLAAICEPRRQALPTSDAPADPAQVPEPVPELV